MPRAPEESFGQFVESLDASDLESVKDDSDECSTVVAPESPVVVAPAFAEERLVVSRRDRFLSNASQASAQLPGTPSLPRARTESVLSQSETYKRVSAVKGGLTVKGDKEPGSPEKRPSRRGSFSLNVLPSNFALQSMRTSDSATIGALPGGLFGGGGNNSRRPSAQVTSSQGSVRRSASMAGQTSTPSLGSKSAAPPKDETRSSLDDSPPNSSSPVYQPPPSEGSSARASPSTLEAQRPPRGRMQRSASFALNSNNGLDLANFTRQLNEKQGVAAGGARKSFVRKTLDSFSAQQTAQVAAMAAQVGRKVSVLEESYADRFCEHEQQPTHSHRRRSSAGSYKSGSRCSSSSGSSEYSEELPAPRAKRASCVSEGSHSDCSESDEVWDGHSGSSSGSRRPVPDRDLKKRFTMRIAGGVTAGMSEKEDDSDDPKEDGEEVGEWIPWIFGHTANMLFGGLIFLNAIYIGLETDLSNEGSENAWICVESIFLIAFTVEIVLRFRYHSNMPLDDTQARVPFCFNLWNVFDTLIVFVGLLDTVVLTIFMNKIFHLDSSAGLELISILRLLRLFRLVRIFRIFRFLHELLLLAQGILDAIKALVWAMLLVMLVLYTNSIITTRLIGQDPVNADSDVGVYFGSVGASLFTLFQMMTLENWSTVAREAMRTQNWTAVFFVIFVLFTNLVLLNLVTGVILENVLTISRREEEKLLQKEEAQRLQTVNMIHHMFAGVLGDLDTDLISLKEFRRACRNPRVVKQLQDLQIATYEAEDLFILMDTQKRGAINIHNFIEGCLRIRGLARAKHLLGVQFDVQKVWSKLSDQLDEVEDHIVEEISRMLASTHEFQEATREEVQKAFQEVSREAAKASASIAEQAAQRATEAQACMLLQLQDMMQLLPPASQGSGSQLLRPPSPAAFLPQQPSPQVQALLPASPHSSASGSQQPARIPSPQPQAPAQAECQAADVAAGGGSVGAPQAPLPAVATGGVTTVQDVDDLLHCSEPEDELIGAAEELLASPGSPPPSPRVAPPPSLPWPSSGAAAAWRMLASAVKPPGGGHHGAPAAAASDADGGGVAEAEAPANVPTSTARPKLRKAMTRDLDGTLQKTNKHHRRHSDADKSKTDKAADLVGSSSFGRGALVRGFASTTVGRPSKPDRSFDGDVAVHGKSFDGDVAVQGKKSSQSNTVINRGSPGHDDGDGGTEKGGKGDIAEVLASLRRHRAEGEALRKRLDLAMKSEDADISKIHLILDVPMGADHHHHHHRSKGHSAEHEHDKPHKDGAKEGHSKSRAEGSHRAEGSTLTITPASPTSASNHSKSFSPSGSSSFQHTLGGGGGPTRGSTATVGATGSGSSGGRGSLLEPGGSNGSGGGTRGSLASATVIGHRTSRLGSGGGSGIRGSVASVSGLPAGAPSRGSISDPVPPPEEPPARVELREPRRHSSLQSPEVFQKQGRRRSSDDGRERRWNE